MNRQTSFVMTQGKTWALTVISVALFVLLCWLFADGLLGPPLWNAEEWTASPLITYVLILLIIGAGWFQAQRIPAEGIPLRAASYSVATPGQVDDPAGWRLLMGNVFLALFWLPIRFFVGREWFAAGLHKITDPAWTGGGEALRGFWERAVAIPEGGVHRSPTTGSASFCSTCSITAGTRGSPSWWRGAKPWSGWGSSSGRWSGSPPSSARC
jgi:hypothetical protein